MLCNHFEGIEVSQDVLDKYGNILVFNENHFQCPI